METAVSFAPLRPADFVNFAGRGGAERGGARPAFRGASLLCTHLKNIHVYTMFTIQNMFYKCKKRIWGKCCKVCRSGFKRSICLGLRLSRSQVIYQFLARPPNGKLYKWSSSMKFTFPNSFEDKRQKRFENTFYWFLPGLKCESSSSEFIYVLSRGCSLAELQ